MMMATVLKPKSFVAFESDFAAKGRFKKIEKSDTQFSSLRIRYETGDARRAEAVARGSIGNDLEILKSLLARGILHECPELIERLRDQAIVDNLQVQYEILQQEARFEFLSGNWKNCVEICNLLDQKLDLAPLSRMAVYQIRSNAYFELSDFANSLSDYKRIESLEQLFPHGQLPLYAKTNQVRLTARTIGLTDAKRQEALLWKQQRSARGTKNLDPILTLLRSRIDLLRLENSDYSREALASALISKAIGDDLYEVLGLIDLYLAQAKNPSAPTLERLLIESLPNHPRAKKLYESVFSSESPSSEISKNMRAYRLSSPQTQTVNYDTSITHILLLNLGLRIDLKNKTAETVELQQRTIELLKELSSGPLTKADLFKKIWKLSNFSMEKHDSVIRTAVARARNQCGLAIVCAERSVSLPATVLILDV